MNEQTLKEKFPNATWFEDGFAISAARHSGVSGFLLPSIIRKPWGFEIWLVFTDSYALKILAVNKGHRLSLQKHNQKQESWLIQSGHPEIMLGESVNIGEPGQLLHIAAGTVHRISAIIDDIEIVEVSTPELDDVVRLSDDYKRE